MIMVLAFGPGPGDVSKSSEAGNGVVYFSQPDVSDLGQIREFDPSVSGLDYIVASQGSGSFLATILQRRSGLPWALRGACWAEISRSSFTTTCHCLSLGSPRERFLQSIITSKRNVNWSMSNEYLRRYLWMRGNQGYGKALDYVFDGVISAFSHMNQQAQALLSRSNEPSNDHL